MRWLLTMLLVHVTVDPSEARKGRFARLAFRVPNERHDATATEFSVRLPAAHPIRHVSVRPDPRWTYRVEVVPVDAAELTEAVSAITWTGGQIRPGEFDEFVVSLGPLPNDTDRLLFPATQTYDDGDIVRFDGAGDGPASGNHPTPTLALVDPDAGHPDGSGHHHADGARRSPSTVTGQDEADPARRRARTSLAIATAGLAVAAVALVRSRRAVTAGAGGQARP